MKMHIFQYLDYIIGWTAIVMSWFLFQVIESSGTLISKAFDYGFVVGLLILGIVALAYHYYRDRGYLLKVISKLSERNNMKQQKLDEHHEKMYEIMERNITASNNSSNSIKELNSSVDTLVRVINNRNN